MTRQLFNKNSDLCKYTFTATTNTINCTITSLYLFNRTSCVGHNIGDKTGPNEVINSLFPNDQPISFFSHRAEEPNHFIDGIRANKYKTSSELINLILTAKINNSTARQTLMNDTEYPVDSHNKKIDYFKSIPDSSFKSLATNAIFELDAACSGLFHFCYIDSYDL